MNRFVTTIAFVALLLCTAHAREQSPAAREQSLLARVTVYWAKGGAGSDRYTRLHKASTGTRLRYGHCAVDPKRIPYGSRIVFPDRTTLLAVDTGTAVKNRKAARKAGRTVYERNALVVDRFFETKGQALAWASRNPAFMAVRVIPPNYRPHAATRVIQPIAPQKRLASSAPVVSTSKQAANAVGRSMSSMKVQ